MPNYSINRMIVIGDSKNIRRFRKNANSAECDLSLNALLPMPKELKNTEAEDEGPNWYNWSVENWGTKWDVDGKLISSFKDYLEYSFKSAWNPPLEWLEKVSKDYPTLQFKMRYFEESDDFLGVAYVKNGRVDDRRLKMVDFENGEDSLMDSLLESARDNANKCAKIIHRISSLLPEGR